MDLGLENPENDLNDKNIEVIVEIPYLNENYL
jgi:hypothetical protein